MVSSSPSNNTRMSTLNREDLRTILASGITVSNQTFSAKPSAKDSLKRKLTARVIPMTRSDGEDIKKSSEDEHGDVQKPAKNHFAASSQFPSTTTCTPATDRVATTTTVMVKTEKPDVSSCQGGSIWNDVGHSNQRGFGSLEPQAKYRRMAYPTPISMASSFPTGTSNQLIPSLTSEPKLLGDNIATLSLLTASQGHLATLEDEDGDTPLHIAIVQGQMQLVQYLTHMTLTSGISLDIYNKLKQTPLHLAVITNQPLIIRILISAGVDANIPDRNGQTAIHLACQRSSIDCLMELVNCRHPINLETKNYAGLSAMHEAVMSNSPDIISFLFSYGANVDSKDGKSGRTPLHYAVEQELVPIIELLINSNASVSAATFSGCTPLQTASGRGMSHITRLLLGSTNEASGRSSGSRWSNSACSSKGKGTTKR